MTRPKPPAPAAVRRMFSACATTSLDSTALQESLLASQACLKPLSARSLYDLSPSPPCATISAAGLGAACTAGTATASPAAKAESLSTSRALVILVLHRLRLRMAVWPCAGRAAAVPGRSSGGRRAPPRPRREFGRRGQARAAPPPC